MKTYALTLCVASLCASALAQDPATLRKQGDAAAKERRWADALAAYEKARPGFEKDPVFLNGLAMTHSYLALANVSPRTHFDAADKLWDAAIRLTPKESPLLPRLLAYQGVSQRALGEWEPDAALKKTAYSQAILAFQKAISLGNEDDRVFNGLGFSFFQLEKYPEAESAARKATAGKPEQVFYQSLLGLALYRQGKYAEAEAPFRKAFALDPKAVENATNMGAVLVKLGRKEEAKPFIQEARRLGLKDDYFAVKELGLAGTPIPAASEPKKLAFKSGAQLLNALLEMQKNIEDANARPVSTLALRSILSNVEALESKVNSKINRKISADGLKDALPGFFGLFLMKQESALTKLTTNNTFPKVAARPADPLEKLVRQVRNLKANFKVPGENKETTPLEFALQDIEKQGKTWPDKERGQVEKALKDLLQVLQDAKQVSDAAGAWADGRVDS